MRRPALTVQHGARLRRSRYRNKGHSTLNPGVACCPHKNAPGLAGLNSSDSSVPNTTTCTWSALLRRRYSRSQKVGASLSSCPYKVNYTEPEHFRPCATFSGFTVTTCGLAAPKAPDVPTSPRRTLRLLPIASWPPPAKVEE